MYTHCRGLWILNPKLEEYFLGSSLVRSGISAAFEAMDMPGMCKEGLQA